MGRNTEAIVKFDPQKAVETEVVYEDPEADVMRLFYSPKRKLITGVSVIRDRINFQFFDEHRKIIQKNLQQKLPGKEIWVEDMNLDENKVLALTTSDRSRGVYYYYDFEKDEIIELADVAPWLDENKMAPMNPIKYQSRDGLTIRGYLTLPVGVEAKNIPVIVYPHGGPWLRDKWGFNPVVQFFANRGYAVLQVNYRGSSGYGVDFWMKGFKQWGQGMQDDVTDGVNWLIEQGIADKSQIAIFGYSFGGYMALCGLTSTPDLYRCGVSYVGITNIFTFLRDIPPAWSSYRSMIYEMVGDPEKDQDMLRKVSPYFNVDKITAPVFIAQGANDPKVNEAETEEMINKLRKKGIPVEYMLKEGEGHGYRNEENRIELFLNIEKFLEKNMGKQN
jgi:dipeptidyl aminopeptidase/acylaminoacyl peptidase